MGLVMGTIGNKNYNLLSALTAVTFLLDSGGSRGGAPNACAPPFTY